MVCLNLRLMKIISKQFSFLLFFTLLVWSGLYAEPPGVDLPLAEWEFTSHGNFLGHIDRRGLYQIRHPFEPAAAGDHGSAKKEVYLPESMKPPYILRFYMSDNIYGQDIHPKAAADVRVGHRFNQVLINGEVVWSRDISVNTPLKDPEYFLVDITPHVKENRKFNLSFRSWQAVDSSEENPGDFVRLGMYAGTTRTWETFPREKYASRSYWGDFAVYSGDPDLVERKVPAWEPEITVKNPHLAWKVNPAERVEILLKTEKQHLLSGEWAWPVSQGIPFPMGALDDVSGIMLVSPGGEESSADFTVMNRWPDGSLRWVLLDTLLPPGVHGNYRLSYGTRIESGSKVPPKNPVSVGTGSFRMENGLILVEWENENGRPDNLIVRLNGGKTIIKGQQPYMVSASGKNFSVAWEKREWISVSPYRAEMAISGKLIAEDGDTYGSCRLRIGMYAGSPLVRILYTIVNKRSEPVPGDQADEKRIRESRGLAGSHRPVTATVASYGLRLLLPSGVDGKEAEGWITAGTSRGWVTGTLRYFRHIWPSGLSADSRGLDFKLFKPGDERMAEYRTYPGEAKTHEIWLALTEERPTKDNCRKLAGLVETPPRFDSSGLVRESCVWGEMPVAGEDENLEIYSLLIERVLAPYYNNTLGGIRLYGGYDGGLNFYWNGLDSMYKLYAMTGERKWYDWAERSIRYYMDICTVHWTPDGRFVGGKNRSADKFFRVTLLHQYTHPLFDHWNMTGDIDGLTLGKANADLIMANEHMVREAAVSSYARAQGWPLIAMVRALQETGDSRYGEYAEKLVDIALGMMEQRRGARLQRHGSHSHFGIVPFVSAILASGLRHYHLWTGDERAAKALVQIAESIYAEMHEPYHSKTFPDIDYYYSPTIYLNREPITGLNLNIVSAQAYAAYITCDRELADIAWRSWRAYVHNGSKHGDWGTPGYLYDLHAALYWLARAPVPDRKLDVEAGQLWRYETGAEEIWFNLEEKSDIGLKLKWSVYEYPYQVADTAHALKNWREYLGKRGIQGEIILMDAFGNIVSSCPLDFSKHPDGAVVNINVSDMNPGVYRLAVRKAGAVPVQLRLQAIHPKTLGWVLPLDRGYIHGGTRYFFRVPHGTEEMEVVFKLLAPWQKETVTLFDAKEKKVRETEAPTGQLAWKIPLPSRSGGETWSLRQSSSNNILLRITGVGVVSLMEEAIFQPSAVFPRDVPETPVSPPDFSGQTIKLRVGETLRVPRGQKTGDGVYSNVHVGEGTIEFWICIDAHADELWNMMFLNGGRMSLYHRGYAGTYFYVGGEGVQSSFVFRPGTWYHVALTWYMGKNGEKPRLNLFVDGISMMGRRMSGMPIGLSPGDEAADWTGSEIRIGGQAGIRIAGLRISSSDRSTELEKGLLSPEPGRNTLYFK